MDVLSLFHPLIAAWFREKIGEPTDVQVQSWQHISGGGHVLITAPTGSGKTLAAFLWAINQLVTGQLTPGYTSVLYISPLRALNNDIRRNLLRPLEELQARFRQAGVPFPDINVETRSGDTSQSERARMLRHPPEILITTPESLNLLLSSQGGRATLKNISTVILDEIHAVLGEKRGVYLMSAVERLVPLSGEFQRIVLSATIKNPELAAKFAGGFRLEGDPKHPAYSPRPVQVVASAMKRRYDIKVRFPQAGNHADHDSVWDPLVAEFKEIIKRNRSTLIFANSRRLCEKLALAINEEEESPVAYVHHGSLSREIRAEVERKLRDGELKAVVATNSLELGIDIGALDEVILVQSPPSISSAIQRVGRAGHQVGQVCKGVVFPTHSHDLLEAAVLSPLILNQDMEEIRPVNAPLNVLAQIIVSMVGVETWDIEALYAQLLTCWSYRSLSREQFELVLNMLAGRYADSLIRELKPQVSIDRLDNTIVARKGALLTFYTSGGVIPDRGLFHLRHQESASLIGELDEEFVWEASVGQTFSLGAQNWRIERITHNDVFVLPGNPHAMATPFWKGEEGYRDFHFSQLIADFLETANDRLDDPDFASDLERENYMEPAAAEELIAFLRRQREISGADLPHRHHLLVELVSTGPGGAPGNQLVLHTLWGNQVNRPFAMALDAAFEAKYGGRLEVYTSNDCIVLQLAPEIRGEDILSLVSSAAVESLLRKRLESSGFFGARFRESAGRALLLPRNRIGQRMPLWMNRLRSQKLLAAVSRYEDFPILLETWRTCLQDEFDLAGLKQVLAELESGAIRWSEIHTTTVSPMAQHIVWRQTEEYMYMTDEPAAGAASNLRDDLLKHVVFTPDLRSAVSPELVAQFEQKRQRLAPGYSPEDPRELVDWVKERLLIPEPEWDDLLKAMQRDHDLDLDELLKAVSTKLVKLQPPSASHPLIVSLENLDRIMQSSPFFKGRLRGILKSGAQASPPVNVVKIESLPPFLLDGGRAKPATSEDNIEDLSFRVARRKDEGGLIGIGAEADLDSLLGEWLQFYGPRHPADISSVLGIDHPALALALEDLVDSQDVIVGQLITGQAGEQVCDSENFEMLLRLSRRAAVPVFEAKDIEVLPLFLAYYQGLGTLQGDIDALFSRLENLRCLPELAGLWESEILPARLHNYQPGWLDTIMQEGSLRWVGGEKHTAAFGSSEDLELLRNDASPDHPEPAVGWVKPTTSSSSGLTGGSKTPSDVHPVPDTESRPPAHALFLDPNARYDFSTLLTVTGLRPAELSDRLWEGVWQGRVSNDTFAALRKGIATRFAPPRMEPPGHSSRRPGRIGFSRWRSSLPFAGNWFLLPVAQASPPVHLEVGKLAQPSFPLEGGRSKPAPSETNTEDEGGKINTAQGGSITSFPLERGRSKQAKSGNNTEDKGGLNRIGQEGGKTSPFDKGRVRGILESVASFSEGPVFSDSQVPVYDLLEIEERMKDRVRLLLDRYGILFRELLERESPLFRWGRVFRALRLMELSGEVLSGYFFKGIPGPQFISQRAFQMLQGRLPANKIYWLNAADPASLCGFGIPSSAKAGDPDVINSDHPVLDTGSRTYSSPAPPLLPRRVPGNHLVYHGTRLVVTSQRNGHTLAFGVPPGDPHLPEYLGYLRHLLGRQFQPLKRITIETINGLPAPESPYLDALKLTFDVMLQGNNVILYRRMASP